MAESSTPVAPHLSAQDMPRFDGTGSPEDFIWAFEAYAALVEWDEVRSLRVLPIALTGLARSWYRTFCLQQSPATIHQATNALLERFGKARRHAGDVAGLMTMQQRFTESLDEFLSRFQEERANIDGVVEDQVLQAAFTAAIKPQLRMIVRRAKPNSFQEAVHAAKDEERALLDEEATRILHGAPTRGANIEKQSATRAPWGISTPPKQTPGPYLPSRPPQQPWGQRSYNPQRLPPQQLASTHPPQYRALPTAQEIQQFRDRAEKEKTAQGLAAIKNEVRLRGLCINCFDKGHFARDCPAPRALYPNSQRQQQYTNQFALDPGYSSDDGDDSQWEEDTDPKNVSLRHDPKWEEHPSRGM
jgi:hypothetical protein